MTDNKLPCAVVRDLLPSYIEGLTEPETGEAVAAHLDHCADCKAKYEAMKSPSGTGNPPAVPEVDYLKTVRKKNRNKIVLAVVLALAAAVAAAALKLFVIGSPAGNGGDWVQAVRNQDGSLRIELASTGSADAYTNWKTEQHDGVMTITVRKVLVSPLNREGVISMNVPLNGAQEVRFFDQVIWKNGTPISPYARRIFDGRTPYVGNAPAVGNLISAMDLDAHTLELHTDAEPYGLTIHFTDVIDPSRHYLMDGAAYLRLALVDNLETVFWTDPSGITAEYSLDRVNAALPGLVDNYNIFHNTHIKAPASIKEMGQSVYTLQQLMNVLKLG